MEGPATWGQITFLVSALLATMTAGFLVAWRIQVFRVRDRHDVRSGYEQQVSMLQDTIETVQRALEDRIHAIELSNAGTLVILKHMEQFQEEVKQQYEQLRKERAEDMERLHRRLDAVHNAARLFKIETEEKRR